MKKFKKFLSAVMASVMCIPVTPAYAAEQDGGDAYTITLTETENGVMQFSETCINHRWDCFPVYQTPTGRRDNNAVPEEGGKLKILS